MKYGVVGPAVNVLARIQTLTTGEEILLSEALLAHVASIAIVSPGRVERAKGASEPVTVHGLLGITSEPASPVISARTD